MSRSFGLVGFAPNFQEKTKDLKLKQVGATPFKEYFYSEGYAFKIYEDENTKVRYEEFEAGCPWSSGPELYLGLRREDNKEVISTWTKSQMGFCEDVELPKNLDPKTFSVFIQEYDLPRLKGYCPLYIEISEHKVKIYQDTEGTSNPDKIFMEIETESGETLRDWLSQQGLSVEETTNMDELREGYRQIHCQFYPSTQE
jgi:hypothetical protein